MKIKSINQDPTKEEMVSFLVSQFGDFEDFEFDIEEAIYYFASHYHGGQSTNLYSALSTSEYRPGLMSSECESIFYDALVEEFAPSEK